MRCLHPSNLFVFVDEMSVFELPQQFFPIFFPTLLVVRKNVSCMQHVCLLYSSRVIHHSTNSHLGKNVSLLHTFIQANAQINTHSINQIQWVYTIHKAHTHTAMQIICIGFIYTRMMQHTCLQLEQFLIFFQNELKTEHF